jgi:multidrug efflux pump subunit AcrB
MKNFIELCVRRPVSVIMFLGALLLGGIFSYTVLPLQRLPEFPFPRVTVETLYPGLGAEDIRSVITIPIEDALSSVKGLERMRSVSRDGASLTVLDFRWGTDGGAASVLVREAIDAIYPSLPEGAAKPAVIPGDPGEDAQIILAVRSPLGPVFARNLAEYEIRSLLRRIDGVGAVMLCGGEREELEIKVDLQKSLSRGLPPAVLAEILATETANMPAGNAREGDKELVVVSRGRPGTAEELKELIFPSQSGPFVIDDLGTLSRTGAKKESLFIVTDGTDTAEYAALEIYRRPGTDPVKLSRDVKKVLAEEAAAFSRDAEIRIIYDDAASIVPGIQKLILSACFGMAAVMGVLFFTLNSISYSILAGLSLPVSMAASLAALAVSGRSLNNMSLSGIALGIGLVSDTSVIILDLFHQSFGKENKIPSCQELSVKAALVASSSLGGTMTTAVVFIPVLFLPGPLGALFGDLSIALVVSITAGWVYSQFALPSLFRIFRVSGAAARSATAESPLINARYAPLLRTAIQKPFTVFICTVLCCTAGLALLLTRPAAFVSADEASEIEAVFNFPPGTAMNSIADEASVIGEKLAALPGISLVFGRAGSETEDTGKRSDPDYRQETFTFRCMLASKKPETVLAAINTLLETLPYRGLARFPQDKTEKLLGLSSAASLAVKGRTVEEAEERRGKAEAVIRGGGLAAGIGIRPSGSRPELRILPDREAIAHTGISTAETARALYAASEGLKAGELELEGRSLDIKVSALELPELETLPVVLTQGGPLFLGTLARIEYKEAAAALARLDRSDVFYIDVSPKPGGERALLRFIASLCTEEKEKGMGRSDESAFTRYRDSLILTVVLVLFLLYLTMGAEFESLTLPLILLLAIPFSLAGAGPALVFAGAHIDSSSVLALMVLFGLSVNGGMVLYELALEKYREGLDSSSAVYEAALERFRPVVTTALTTAFALLPLVLSPLGAREHSMAAAMLGGIIASTALTLFALPPVLIRFLKGKNGG